MILINQKFLRVNSALVFDVVSNRNTVIVTDDKGLPLLSLLPTGSTAMKITIQELEDDFDTIMTDVENGKDYAIVDEDGNTLAHLIPYETYKSATTTETDGNV